MPLPYTILIIIILMIFNAIFSACEMSLVTLNPAIIDFDIKKGKKGASRIKKLQSKPTRFLSTIQLGTTLFGYLNGAIGANSITNIIVTNNENIADMQIWILIGITVLLTFTQVIFGELIPKRVAMRYPSNIAYFTTPIIQFVSLILRPFILILTITANLITKPLGIKKDSIKDVSPEEIKMIIQSESDKGNISKHDSDMLGNIFSLQNTEVQKIMTHRTDIIGISSTASLNEILQIIKENQYTRYPVYRGSIDHIIGILNVKDLYQFFNNKSKFNLKQLMRTPQYVPESLSTKELFLLMRKSKEHLAVIVDEYGGTSGVIALEDLVEEVFGDISDEYDDETKEVVKRIEEDKFIVCALNNIDDIEQELNLGLPIDDYETLSGFIIGQIKHIPQDDEKVSFDFNNFHYEILTYDEDGLIDEVIITKIKGESE